MMFEKSMETSVTNRMATGACQMMFQCVFEGSISLHDMEIERRPYHKNCGCALHNLNDGICSKACPQQRYVSFSKKTSWTDYCMHTTASKFSSHQSFLSKTRHWLIGKVPLWLWRVNHTVLLECLMWLQGNG